MLSALIAPLLHSVIAAGAPVGPDSGSPTSDTSTTPAFNTNYRSTIQIVWTCFAIIFASTWVCIHPHLPGYREPKPDGFDFWGKLKRVSLRGRLFVNALLFPDQFVARAFRERRGSRALYENMKLKLQSATQDPRWTRAQRLGGDIHRLVEDANLVRQRVKQPRNVRKDGEAAQAEESKQPSESSRPDEKGGSPEVRDLGEKERELERLQAIYQELETRWRELKDLIAEQMPGPSEAAKLKAEGDNLALREFEKDWTMVHATFIHMGGVVFKDRDGNTWYKDFNAWTDEDVKGFFDLKLTKEKLEDWSKADGLAKAFVILQCLWFVLQCVGPCNVGMYVFWWNKPLNVNCPEIIQTSSKRPIDPENPEDASTPAWIQWLKMGLKTLATGDIGILLFPRRGRDDSISSSSSRFPVNYYYRSKDWDDKWDKHVEDLTQTVPLAIFGSLHAIGWFGTFPSVYEKILWRASSVVPATLALLLVLLFYIRRGINGNSLPPESGSVLKTFLHCLVYLVLPINLAARYVFVVLPVFQLRDLPSLAHQTVSWADFLPHV